MCRRLSSRRTPALAVLAAALLSFAAPGEGGARASSPLPVLGLMGTIPIYWGEAGELADLLDGGAEIHWARARLEADYTLRPLDTLSDESLADLRFLLLAQPRALSPAENVALDGWVRAGGRLLLFADPMLTGDSRFAIGDRRRPQDVIVLSPILRHWGLELEIDLDQPEGFAMVATSGVRIPVNLPGQFVRAPDGRCAIDVGGLLARCPLGSGRATILADAAMLDLRHAHPAAAGALGWLLEQSFGPAGDFAGKPTQN